MVPQVSRKAVTAATVALIAVATYGAYKGFRGSVSESDVSAAAESALVAANSLSARQASPLVEPPPLALTEAQIRTIARQEAQAALTAREAPPEEPSEAAAPVPAPRPPASTPAPAPSSPAPPPSEANQPPLF